MNVESNTWWMLDGWWHHPPCRGITFSLHIQMVLCPSQFPVEISKIYSSRLVVSSNTMSYYRSNKQHRYMHHSHVWHDTVQIRTTPMRYNQWLFGNLFFPTIGCCCGGLIFLGQASFGLIKKMIVIYTIELLSKWKKTSSLMYWSKFVHWRWVVWGEEFYEMNKNASRRHISGDRSQVCRDVA